MLLRIKVQVGSLIVVLVSPELAPPWLQPLLIPDTAKQYDKTGSHSVADDG